MEVGVRGRKPQPAQVAAQKAAIHSTRKPVKPRPAVQAQPFGDVAAPQGMSPAAARLWNAYAPRQIAAKLLGPLDVEAFKRWCVLTSRFDAVGDKIAELGLVYEADTQTGGKMLRHNPASILELRYSAELNALDAKFGMTPSDRQRIFAERARAQGDLFGIPAASEPGDTAPAQPRDDVAAPSPVGLLN